MTRAVHIFDGFAMNEGFSDQITWVYTTDIRATAGFYEDILQLPAERDAGTARIYRTGASSLIGLCEVFADRVVEPRGGMITLIVDDVDEWHERLTEKGADILGPPESIREFGIYSFFLRDPNGYLIEIQRFDAP